MHHNIYEKFLKAAVEESQSPSEHSQQTKLPYVSSVKYSATNPRQVQATDALISLVAEAMLPLSIVEMPAFNHFAQMLDPQFLVPSRKHLSYTLLESKNKAIIAKVKDFLHQAKSVALKLDLWSNRQMRGFIGITCHFINDSWSMQSIMLCCKRFRGQHTAENIAQYYEEMISTFNIVGKVTTVVTDNASNVVKAFHLPGFANTADDDDDEASSSDEDDDDSIIIPDEDSLDGSDSSLSPYNFIIDHEPCFAHTHYNL